MTPWDLYVLAREAAQHGKVAISEPHPLTGQTIALAVDLPIYGARGLYHAISFWEVSLGFGPFCIPTRRVLARDFMGPASKASIHNFKTLFPQESEHVPS